MAHAKTTGFDSELVQLAVFGKALGHPARIEILRYLASQGELPCMAIVDHLPLSQPASSRHINELLRAGLLQSRTDRTHIYYSVRGQTLDVFCEMTNHVLHSKRVKPNGSTLKGALPKGAMPKELKSKGVSPKRLSEKSR